MGNAKAEVIGVSREELELIRELCVDAFLNQRHGWILPINRIKDIVEVILEEKTES